MRVASGQWYPAALRVRIPAPAFENRTAGSLEPEGDAPRRPLHEDVVRELVPALARLVVRVDEPPANLERRPVRHVVTDERRERPDEIRAHAEAAHVGQ